MTWRLLSFVCFLGACGATSASPSSAIRPSRATASTATPSALPVVVTGVLMRRGPLVEICPGSSDRSCAGIEVGGEVSETWLSSPQRTTVWKISGTFDGRKLVARGAEASGLGQPPQYRNACPEFQEPAAGANPDDQLTTEVATLLSEQRQRVAGHWWDMQRQTMVVSVTGDGKELAQSVRGRFPRARICIQGGARFSEPELEQARARADRVLSDGGVVWSSSSIDVVRNRVVYDAEVLDAPTRERLAREVGDAVAVIAFIQLTDHAREALPAPTRRGDVELVTANSRSGAAMAALGRFTVHYDDGLACVYLKDAEGRRVLPVWPFGYWATARPLQIYDYDDQPVAGPGATIDFGGGGVDIEHIDAPNSCGAKTAWVGSPQRRTAPSAR